MMAKTQVQTDWVFVSAIQATSQIYTNQTGKFPIPSSCGNKYIMVLYNYDSNAIITGPMKSQAEQDMIHTYTKLHTYRSNWALLQKLNNEAPAGLKWCMQAQEVKSGLPICNTDAMNSMVLMHAPHMYRLACQPCTNQPRMWNIKWSANERQQ